MLYRHSFLHRQTLHGVLGLRVFHLAGIEVVGVVRYMFHQGVKPHLQGNTRASISVKRANF